MFTDELEYVKTCFRLTIRNVNVKTFLNLQILVDCFRLTIRNVNKSSIFLLGDSGLCFRLTIRNVNIKQFDGEVKELVVLD